MSSRVHGPFVHTLNKGGLREIVASQRLRATNASNHLANDSPAVRAYVGTFEYQRKNKNWRGKDSVHIEFTTYQAPRSGLPPGYAEWTTSELVDGHLQISISRIVNGDGEPVHP